MRAIVTGGTGLLGSALVTALTAQGWQVLVLSRHPSTRQLSNTADVTYYYGDVGDEHAWDQFSLWKNKIDVLYHCAGCIQLHAPWRILYRTNVQGTALALQCARQLDIPRLVIASSTAVTGCMTPEEIPAKEDDPPRPISAYGKSKWMAEQLVSALSPEARQRVMILRISTIYANLPHFLVPAIAEIIKRRGRLLTVLDAFAHHLFHPVYLNDAIDALLVASLTRAPGGTYFIAGPDALPIGALFSEVAAAIHDDRFSLKERSAASSFKAVLLDFRRSMHQLLHREDFLSFLSMRSGRRIHRVYTCTRAAEAFGYAPRINIREGIRRCLTGYDHASIEAGSTNYTTASVKSK